MKTRIVLALFIIIIFFESCSHNFTPYQAANNPRGKKCGVIK
jgi:PBP1b-binding outer membrane lipoprotein LpoB